MRRQHSPSVAAEFGPARQRDHAPLAQFIDGPIETKAQVIRHIIRRRPFWYGLECDQCPFYCVTGLDGSIRCCRKQPPLACYGLLALLVGLLRGLYSPTFRRNCYFALRLSGLQGCIRLAFCMFSLIPRIYSLPQQPQHQYRHRGQHGDGTISQLQPRALFALGLLDGSLFCCNGHPFAVLRGSHVGQSLPLGAQPMQFLLLARVDEFEVQLGWGRRSPRLTLQPVLRRGDVGAFQQPIRRLLALLPIRRLLLQVRVLSDPVEIGVEHFDQFRQTVTEARAREFGISIKVRPLQVGQSLWCQTSVERLAYDRQNSLLEAYCLVDLPCAVG